MLRSMSGEGKRSVCLWLQATAPLLDSTVDGPLLARGLTGCNRSVCDHMSGLLMRPHMTAAKMGYTARVPNNPAALDRPMDSPECLASWIAGSHHLSFSSKLRAQRDGEARRRAELGRGGIRSSWDPLRAVRTSELRPADGQRRSAGSEAGQGWPKATARGGAKRP